MRSKMAMFLNEKHNALKREFWRRIWYFRLLKRRLHMSRKNTIRFCRHSLGTVFNELNNLQTCPC